MVNSIREYAAERGTFVILNVEHGDVYEPGSDMQQLFDFAAGGMRPREIFLDNEGNKVNVDGYKNNSDNKFNDQNDKYSLSVCGVGGTYDEKMYEGTACEDNSLLTFIDNCHGTFNVATSQGGTSPKGCDWEKTPTLIYWDNGPGCYNDFPPTHWLPSGEVEKYYTLLKKDCDCSVDACDVNGNCACDSENYEDCKANNGISVSSVWGWDDKNWWVFGLGDDNDCRLDWMKINSERVRNFSNDGNSFLTVMGREQIGCWNNQVNYPIRNYRLVDNPILRDGLINFMTPSPITKDDIIVESKCTTTILEECGTIDICNETIDVDSRIKEYTFTVNNPSPTSIYSWHFQKEDGTWLPLSYGRERKLLISEEIKLRVSLRQDDFGLDNAYGVIEVYEEMILKPCCVDEIKESSTEYGVKVFFEGCLANLYVQNPPSGTEFYWTFTPILPLSSPSIGNQSGESAVIDLSENNAVSYCLGSYNQNTGVFTTQSGVIFIHKDCYDRPKISIIPNPINKRTDRRISIELQDKNVINEVLNQGKKLEFYIIRSIDSRKVKEFLIESEVTEIDISDLERGSYTLFTNSFGRAYNENFIVIDDF